MKIYIPCATERAARAIGSLIEAGTIRISVCNLTEEACQEYINAMPNGGTAGGIASPEITYRPWPVEVTTPEEK